MLYILEEEGILLLFSGMIISRKRFLKSVDNLFEIINQFNRVSVFQTSIQELRVFL